ncbi:MAG: Flp family type IVb pilin [Actinobacteria bacterium]|nr:Flp family type IVb pilin [Actinomycetota bacterium]
MYTGLRTSKKDTGASAVEYGLLVAAIALVVIAAVFFLGGAVSDSFNEVGSAVSSAGG